MNNKLKISLAQLDLSWENSELNLDKAEKCLIQNTSADLFVFPELFTTGFTMNVKDFGEEMNGKTICRIKDLAVKYKTAICGSVIIKENQQFFNRLVFIKPDSSLIYYDKRHLFRMGEENNYYTSGNSKIIIEYKGFRILPLICYDLRFPVWSRYQGDYDMIIYIANWPAKRRSHWDVLLQARAIENQAFVVGVNRIGKDENGFKYNGGTQVFDALGNKLIDAKDNVEQIISAEIDLSSIKDTRDNFPAWKDKDDFSLKY